MADSILSTFVGQEVQVKCADHTKLQGIFLYFDPPSGSNVNRRREPRLILLLEDDRKIIIASWTQISVK